MVHNASGSVYFGTLNRHSRQFRIRYVMLETSKQVGRRIVYMVAFATSFGIGVLLLVLSEGLLTAITNGQSLTYLKVAAAEGG